jgi:hypothetical protein
MPWFRFLGTIGLYLAAAGDVTAYRHGKLGRIARFRLIRRGVIACGGVKLCRELLSVG